MKLSFELSVEQANIIMAGLGELPFKVAEGVIAEMRKQAAPQMQPVEDAAAVQDVAPA